MTDILIASPWPTHERQYARVGYHQWSVSRLLEYSKDLPVFSAQLAALCIDFEYGSMPFRDLLMHTKAAYDADLSYPIILDETGALMDGRHRILKAHMLGDITIKAVRFDINPPPCALIRDEDGVDKPIAYATKD